MFFCADQRVKIAMLLKKTCTFPLLLGRIRVVKCVGLRNSENGMEFVVCCHVVDGRRNVGGNFGVSVSMGK